MESILANQSHRGTTMRDDPSCRQEKRPSSSQAKSQESKSRSQSQRTDLAQAPGKGQWFDDAGSSFPSKPNKPSQNRKPKPSRGDFDSDSDEMDFLSQKSDIYDDDEPPRKTTSTLKGKGKVKVSSREAESETDMIEVDGRMILMHPKHKPRQNKLPKINKIKSSATEDVSGSQESSQSKSQTKPSTTTSSTRPKPRPVPPSSSLGSLPAKGDSCRGNWPRSKPNSATSSSRAEPLHTRSPNEPSPQNGLSKPRPRPRPAPLKQSDTGTCDTDMESPVKGPQRTKTLAAFPMEDLTPVADRRVQKESKFPLTPPTKKPKRTDTFPSLSPLSTNKINDVDDGSDDELGFDENDEIINRGGLRPFPMATQELQSIRRSDDANRDDDDVNMEHNNYADVSQFDDSLFLDPSVDPSTLCPYCDEPLPSEPTPYLTSLLESTRKKSYPDARPSNPLGRKAPLATFIAVCQRHRFESVELPEARRKHWPTAIRFELVRERVENMKDRLEAIIRDVDIIKDGDSDDDDDDGVEKGPRKKSVFWQDIKKQVKKKGSRAVVGVNGQFASFEKTQPGYYGELGSVIIHQTLYNLFPPSDFDPTLITPLTPPEFIQRILVPEAAVGLIMEDRGADINDERKRAKAIATLRESVAYGVAMFPDADTSVGGKGSNAGLVTGKKGRGEWNMGVGDEIVKERARARRRELEEEERVEEEMWKRREQEQGGAKSKDKRKGKAHEEALEISDSSDTSHPKARPRPRKVQQAKLDDHMSDASERSEGTRPRPRPRPIRSKQPDENMFSDTSERSETTRPKPRRVQPQTKTDGSDSNQRIQKPKSTKASRSGSPTVDVDLCSDSSTSSKANWTSGLGRLPKKSSKKARALSKTPELQYPATDIEKTSSDLELQYPASSPNRKVIPQSSMISLLSEDEDNEPTPKPKKVASRPVPVPVPSRASSSLTKGKTPLEIARERRKDRGPSKDGWKYHMDPPEPMEVDIDISDGDQTEGSTHSMRGSNARKKVQQAAKEDPGSYSWLLSQESNSDKDMEYGDSH